MMSSQPNFGSSNNSSDNNNVVNNNNDVNNNNNNNNNSDDLEAKIQEVHETLKQIVLAQLVDDQGDQISAANESLTPDVQTLEEFIASKRKQGYEFYEPKSKIFYARGATTLTRGQRKVGETNVYPIASFISYRIERQYVTKDGETPTLNNSNPNRALKVDLNMRPILRFREWKKSMRSKNSVRDTTNETVVDKGKRKGNNQLRPGEKKQRTISEQLLNAVEQAIVRENDPMEIECSEIPGAVLPTITTTTTTTTARTNRAEQTERGHNDTDVPANDHKAISNFLCEKVKNLPVDSNGKFISLLQGTLSNAPTFETFIEQKKAQGYYYCDGKGEKFYGENEVVRDDNNKIKTPDGKPAYTFIRLIVKRAKQQLVYTSTGQPVHPDKLPLDHGVHPDNSPKITRDIDGKPICKFNSYLTKYYNSKKPVVDALLSLPETSTTTSTTSATSTAPDTMENEGSNQVDTPTDVHSRLTQQVKAQKVDSSGNPIPTSQEGLYPDAKTFEEFLIDQRAKGYNFTNSSGKNFYQDQDVTVFGKENFATKDGKTKLYYLSRATQERATHQWVYAKDCQPVPLQELPDNHHTASLKTDNKGNPILRFYAWRNKKDKATTSNQQPNEQDFLYQENTRTKICALLTKQVMEQKVNAFGKPIPASQESDHPDAKTLEGFLADLKNRKYIYCDSRGEEFYKEGDDKIKNVNNKLFYEETQLYTLSRVCKQRRTQQWVYTATGKPVPFQALPDNHHYIESLEVDNSGQQICRFYTWDYKNRKSNKKAQKAANQSNSTQSTSASTQSTSAQETNISTHDRAEMRADKPVRAERAEMQNIQPSALRTDTAAPVTTTTTTQTQATRGAPCENVEYDRSENLLRYADYRAHSMFGSQNTTHTSGEMLNRQQAERNADAERDVRHDETNVNDARYGRKS